jgi:hypothetical protein
MNTWRTPRELQHQLKLILEDYSNIRCVKNLMTDSFKESYCVICQPISNSKLVAAFYKFAIKYQPCGQRMDKQVYILPSV